MGNKRSDISSKLEITERQRQEKAHGWRGNTTDKLAREFCLNFPFFIRGIAPPSVGIYSRLCHPRPSHQEPRIAVEETLYVAQREIHRNDVGRFAAAADPRAQHAARDPALDVV